MSPWKPIINRAFTPEAFDSYCRLLRWSAWRPQFIVLHNTGTPTLAERPRGFTPQAIDNLVTYYRDQLGWSAGPHLFVDDRQITVFTPLTTPGVHAPSWNTVSLGVEMLGNYSTEDFHRGRGLHVHRNAVAAIATLSVVLALDSSTMRLHHEDPQTTHRDCPGAQVVKLDFIREVHQRLLHLPQC